MQENPVVILTREAGDNRLLAPRLEALGFRPVSYPCIETAPVPEKEKRLPHGTVWDDFRVVVFTSKRGVAGMAGMADMDGVPGFLARPDRLVAVVGAGTASAFKELTGGEPDVVACPSTSEALARYLVQILGPPERVLHVRGNKSTGIFKKIMEEHGFPVEDLIVYRNRAPEKDPLEKGREGLVVFASPSAVKCFFQYNRPEDHNLTYLAGGPVTGDYLKSKKLPRVFESRDPGTDALVEAIQDIFGK